MEEEFSVQATRNFFSRWRLFLFGKDYYSRAVGGDPGWSQEGVCTGPMRHTWMIIDIYGHTRARRPLALTTPTSSQ